MGVGSAIVVAAVAVGAVTVLPTLMGAFAKRLRPKNPRAPSRRARRFERWATPHHARARRPPPIAGTLVLLALATPVLGLRLGMPDDGNDAKGTTTRVAYDRLAEGFGVGFNGPLVLATDNMGDAATDASGAREKTPGVAFVSEPVHRARQGRGDAHRDPDDLTAGPEDERPRRPTSATTSPTASTSAARSRCSTTWRPRSPRGCRSSSRS